MAAIFVFLPMACYNKHGYYVNLYVNLRKQYYLPRCYTFSIVHSAWCVGMTVKVRESALCTENICNFHCTEQSKVSRDIKKKSQPPVVPNCRYNSTIATLIARDIGTQTLHLLTFCYKGQIISNKNTNINTFHIVIYCF